MKKIFFKQLLAVLLLFTGTTAGAQTFRVDEFDYTIIDETEMTVELKNIYGDYWEEVIIPSTVIYEGNTYNVTSIGEKAFNSRSYITTVTIPDGITNIGAYAFANCTKLTNIKIPGSVTNIGNYAFSACKSLTEIIIPEGVTHIGKSAFDNCTALTTVTIPTSVKVMIGAFGNCTNIKTVNISDLTAYCNIELIDNSYINSYYGEQVPLGSYASNPLYNHISVNNDNEHGGYIHTYSAPRDLVLNGKKIVNLVIPADVDSITGHFMGCSAETISFEERDETTGDCSLTLTSYTFSGMGNLKKVTLPDFDVQLGIGTFLGCTSLEEITIGRDYQWAYDCHPDRVYYPIDLPNEIEIFQGCTHLRKLTAKERVTKIPDMFGPQFSRTGKRPEHLPIDSLIIPNLEIQSWVRPQTIDYLNEVAWYNSTLDLTTECNVLIAGEPVKAKSGELVIPEGVKKIYDGKVSGMGITKVTLPNSLTHIHYDAFANCTELKEINIPENVTFIGKGAFDNTAIYNNCTEKLLYIDNWLVAYKNENLGDIKVKEGTKKIADRLFIRCTGLTGIELPASLTTIDDFAFEYCTELKNITIPSSVTYIGFNAFAGCSSLESITIPSGITTIYSGTFSGCSSLESVTIPNNVTTIYDTAFGYCTSLKEITFGSNIKKIGSRAFEETAWYNNCSDGPLYLNNWLLGYKGNFEQDSLIVKEGTVGIADDAHFQRHSHITLPQSLKYIGENAITCNDKCTFTVNATTPPTMEENSIDNKNNHTLIVKIGTGVLKAYRQNSYWRSFGTIIASNTIGNFEYRPANAENTTIGVYKYVGNDSIVKISAEIEFEGELLAVTKINKDAFYKNTGITSVTIPNSTTVIEGYAFDGCSNLASINIPSGITEIEEATFRDCTRLSAISIPNSVTLIGEQAFKNCSSLEHATIGNGVEYIASEAFYNCTSLKGALAVPNRVTEIGANAFFGCSSLISVDIPNSVISIGNNAFYQCSGLERVTIGNGIESIGSTAFRLCSNLKKVEVDCAEVGTWFNSLSSIEQVVLGKNVQSIVRRAFYNTKNTTLTSVTSLIPADALFAVNDLVKDYSICTLYVPTGAKETYAATSGWSDFANIVEMDLTGVEKVKGQSGESKAIYDLQGRKVDAPSNGIYIIDGKKVWIK